MNEIEKLFADTMAEDKAPEPLSEGELRQRYVERMNALADDANERGMLPLLVEVAAWKLAAIACRCGPVAAGDVVRQLGNHMHGIAVRERAQREANDARAEGRRPH